MQPQYELPWQISVTSMKALWRCCSLSPSCICWMCIGTTHQQYMLFFIVKQNLDAIGAVVFIIWKLLFWICGIMSNATRKRHVLACKLVIWCIDSWRLNDPVCCFLSCRQFQCFSEGQKTPQNCPFQRKSGPHQYKLIWCYDSVNWGVGKCIPCKKNLPSWLQMFSFWIRPNLEQVMKERQLKISKTSSRQWKIKSGTYLSYIQTALWCQECLCTRQKTRFCLVEEQAHQIQYPAIWKKTTCISQKL